MNQITTQYITENGACYDHFAVFNCDAQFLRELSGQCALCALYGYQVVFALYFNARRNTNRFFSYS